VIREEYSAELKKEKKRYKRLLGKYNCREKGIACSEDEMWLETGNLKSPVV
jgi:hypothetical protein